MINKNVIIFKNTKWISFETYLMTVEGFGYNEGFKSYNPLLNTFDYKPETFIVNAVYKNKSYFIENKKLYKNVSIGDKIIVTIKYFYDKNDTIIHSTIHHFHPYPLSSI